MNAMPGPPMTTEMRSALGNAWLCQAWGETDRPIAEIVYSIEAIREFIISDWVGSADDEELPGIMEQIAAHDWDEPLEWTFEIGGVRLTNIYHNQQAAWQRRDAADARAVPTEAKMRCERCGWNCRVEFSYATDAALGGAPK